MNETLLDALAGCLPGGHEPCRHSPVKGRFARVNAQVRLDELAHFLWSVFDPGEHPHTAVTEDGDPRLDVAGDLDVRQQRAE
eukprot:16427571-Heterocapsa_arctica.AAC.1